MKNNFEEIDDFCFDALNGYNIEPSAGVKESLKKKMFFRNLFNQAWFKLSMIIFVAGITAAGIYFAIPTSMAVKQTSTTSAKNNAELAQSNNSIKSNQNATENINSNSAKQAENININTGKQTANLNEKLQVNSTNTESQISKQNKAEFVNTKNNRTSELQTGNVAANNNKTIVNQVNSANETNNKINQSNNEQQNFVKETITEKANTATLNNSNETAKNSNNNAALVNSNESPVSVKTSANTEQLLNEILMQKLISKQGLCKNEAIKIDTIGKNAFGKPITMKTSFISIGAFYSAYLNNSVYSSNNTEFTKNVNYLNQNNEKEISHNFGLSIAANKMRWGIESGIYLNIQNSMVAMPFALSNQRFVYSTVYNGTPYDYTNNNQYFDIDTTGYYHYTWTQDSTIHVTDSVWVNQYDSTQLNVFDTVQSTAYDTTKANANYTSYHVEVPLLVTYDLVGKQFGLTIKGGLIAGYTFNTKGSIFKDENIYILSSTRKQDYRNLQCSAYIALALKYSISDRLTLIAEPYYRRWLLSEFTKNRAIANKPDAWGIKAGLTYDF